MISGPKSPFIDDDSIFQLKVSMNQICVIDDIKPSPDLLVEKEKWGKHFRIFNI